MDIDNNVGGVAIESTRLLDSNRKEVAVEKKYTIQEIRTMIMEWGDGMNVYRYRDYSQGIIAVQKFLQSIQESNE
jgi:hypothetical protein